MRLFHKFDSSNLGWTFVVILFFLGFCLRLVVFIEPHREGDELIYRALVNQLNNNNGYTLQGTTLLEDGIIDRNEYDHPLFFHPPGGIGLFWLFYRVLGYWGYPLVQVFCYVLFFWSMILLASLIGLSSSSVGLALVGGLSAFTPIMAHVTTNYWLDGPLLGFSTLAAVVFIWAVVRNSYLTACVAGVILGYASLIKITAFLIIPGITILSWIFLKPPKWGLFIRFCICLLLPAIIVQIPWEIWQWIKLGTPFPGWSGKPSETLIASNRYVHYLTVIRSPWTYLSLTPRIVWTFIPCILLYISLWNDKTIRWYGLSFFTWIFIVLSFHIALGFLGYSKVIRYVILITPASTMLFSLLMAKAIPNLRLSKPFSAINLLSVIIVGISGIAFFMEIAAGIKSSFSYNADLIIPMFGNF